MTRYEIVRLLGTGGMANVHLARDTRANGRLIALKQVHAFLEEDDAARHGRLVEEAHLASRIDHPNVVRVLDVVEHEGRPALAMEWIDGTDLAASSGTFSLASIIAIVRDVLEGVKAVHDADIVHGDVSPPNILVGRDGAARLTDFGLASSRSMPIAELATVSGTLGYMAPEQLERRADARSDLFSVGVVLWELLTGQRYRKATSGVEAFVEILWADPTPPSAHRPEAAFLDDLVLRALARDPADRFESAQAMLDGLAEIRPEAEPLAA